MRKVLLFAVVAVLAISSLALAAPKTAPIRSLDNGAANNTQGFVATTKPYAAKASGITADTLGLTNFDWMHNGGMGQQVVADQVGGLHFGWTYRDLAGSAGSRYPAYNHFDAANGWLGVTNAANGPGRWGTVGCKTTGEGLFAYYWTSGANYPNMMAVDAVPGMGLFDVYAIDTLPPAQYNWAHPYLATVGADTMYTVNDGDLDQPMFSYSYDGGVNWSTHIDPGAGADPFDFPNYNIAAWHNKIGISHLDTNDNVVYIESQDYGATWGPWTVAIANGGVTPDLADTVHGYIQTNCYYDANGKLYVMDSYYQNTAATVDYNNGVAVWDSVNGLRTCGKLSITDPGGWDQIGGGNTIAISWPRMTQTANGNLVISYIEFNRADTSANGFANGELYAVKSTDDGNTWGVKTSVSKSPSPDAADGSAEDDRYSDLVAVGDTVHFAWLCSKVAGSFLQAESAASMDPMLHVAVAVADLGVEGTSNDKTPSTKFALNQSNPNPARTLTSISFNLPKAGNYSLKVYNIAGQEIRTLDGQGVAGKNTVTWNGLDNNSRKVANGVYLYNLKANGNSATKKLVVVR